MNKALIIIDFVNDFVADGGKLTCGEPAQKIDKALAETISRFAGDGGFIVAATDCHTENDIYSPENGLFPAHCIAGSSGCELYGMTAEAVERVRPEQLIRFSKTRYSAFAGTGLDMMLRARNVTEVFLTGVCTDICVLHTAVDAYNLGYKINIYESCVASFNEIGHNFALAHFKNTLGAAVL